MRGSRLVQGSTLTRNDTRDQWAWKRVRTEALQRLLYVLGLDPKRQLARAAQLVISTHRARKLVVSDSREMLTHVGDFSEQAWCIVMSGIKLDVSRSGNFAGEPRMVSWHRVRNPEISERNATLLRVPQRSKLLPGLLIEGA